MALVEVDKQTCTKCGICAAACPAGIIHFKENSFPRLLPRTDEICLRCGHCVAVCPSGSVVHREIPLDKCPTIKKSLGISFDQCAQLIKSRRSVREFQDKAVPKEEIERVIEVARYAPTGHNNQEVQWLVINDHKTVRQLAAIGADWMLWTIQNNSEFAPTLEDFLKKQEAGIDMFLRNAPAVVIAFAEKNNPIAATDCVIALSYFDLAAKSAGLGCCWAGLLNFAAASFPAMVEAVALPEGFAPYGALMVGYPKYKYRRVPSRKPARIIYRP
jgi:nitroreductase/NAD-dependent dihydropyrimidine dehydrogenase PreA subunit